ncbi:hypothetical protein [Actinoplanes regularis]|uniref:hypothetical protein n=1 Tax=Actinoplanes regularis TaxID=52697 RepID=UPI0024A15F85|nr:hypothetical protein [Actinoplanes regularis]GLW30034.1 hypothetical protein Areg01_29740 [Actinoplanes regularis]
MKRTRPARLGTALLCLAVSLTGCLGPSEGGDELSDQNDYGAATSRDVGTRFTDGVTAVEYTKGPIRLLSVKPIMDDGGTLSYLGARVRIMNNPAWLPHTTADEFPPTHPEMAGSTAVQDFIVPAPPSDGQTHYFELMFGFEVTKEGRSARRGAELVYEYDGNKYTRFIPSYVAVCSPKSIRTDCPGEDADGPDGTMPPPKPAPAASGLSSSPKATG